VWFRVLHPPAHFPELGNESSCVLLVSGAGGRSLLPGDISEVVEARLLREHGVGLAAELLVVPHHGSRSSSGAAWVEQVAPRWAAIAAGAGNRFGHPHPEVLERYLGVGSELVETSRDGRASWLFTASGARLETLERRDRRRFWDVAGP
jgi:competence protein ComEC